MFLLLLWVAAFFAARWVIRAVTELIIRLFP